MTLKGRTHHYLAGLASGYVVTLATIVVGLWLTPFTLRYLDREQFAVFVLASDVLMWLGLLEIGLTSVLNVQAAQLSARPDPDRLNRLASTTFFAQSTIALGVMAAGGVIALYFPDFFGLRAELRREGMQVMALMALGSALTVGSQTFSALLIAHQQIHVDNMIRLSLIAIRTALTVGLLMAGYGLISLAVAHLVAVVLTALLAVVRVWRLLPGLSLRVRHCSWAILRQTSGLGIWFSLGGLAGILIMNLDKIMTAKLVSVEMVTLLSLTGRLYVLAWSVIQQVTNTARPALAQIIGQGDLEGARRKYHQLSMLSTGLALVAAVGIWAGNGVFVSWWVGSQNYGGALLDGLLALNLIVHSWVLPNRAILTAGLIFVPQNSTSRFIEGLVNLGLSMGLGWFYGVPGIILATALAGIFVSCWYLPLLTARFFKTHLISLVVSDFFKLIGISVLLIFGVYYCRMVGTSISGLQGAVLASGLSVIIGFLALWYIGLDVDTKFRIRHAFYHKSSSSGTF